MVHENSDDRRPAAPAVRVAKPKAALDVPVAIMVFRRPEQTAEVMAAVRAARPSQLFVVADGPRADRPGELEACEATRRIATAVDWDCEVKTNFADTNLGLRGRMPSGISWVFEHVDRAVLLEDDCVPQHTFFNFCDELLEKYNNNDQVMMLSGDNAHGFSSPHSYYFTKYALIWGWATWRDAWAHFDLDMPDWPVLSDSGWLRDLLDDRRAANFWYDWYQRNYEGFNSWATPWMFACWRHGGVSANASVNLISNIGYGEHATHTTNSGEGEIRSGAPLDSLTFPLVHPPEVARDLEADDFVEQTVFSGRYGVPLRGFTKETRLRDLKQASLLSLYGRNREALEIVERVDAAKPGDGCLAYGRALLHARLGQGEKARSILLERVPETGLDGASAGLLAALMATGHEPGHER